MPEPRNELAPNIQPGEEIFGTALVGHSCRMPGLIVLVETTNRETGASEYLYVLGLSRGGRADFRLLSIINLWDPFAAHPEAPALPQDRPINQIWEPNTCATCVARDKILAEAKLALELIHRFLKTLSAASDCSAGPIVEQMRDLAMAAAEKIAALTDSQKPASTLEPNIKEPY